MKARQSIGSGEKQPEMIWSYLKWLEATCLAICLRQKGLL